MTKYREILRLKSLGFSERNIAHSCGVSRNTVDYQNDTDYSFIEELLPWSDQLPEICRSKSKSTNL